MINLAGDTDCDIHIRKELEQAGIEIFDIGIVSKSEVPSRLTGNLNGWAFTRAWYYWVASGQDTLLLFEVADELHKQHGDVVRVCGHCGAPSPREWCDQPWQLGVASYHVDTQDGLNALADAMRAQSKAATELRPK